LSIGAGADARRPVVLLVGIESFFIETIAKISKLFVTSNYFMYLC
jgi:hypothetical protein